jgi:GNAT superfamily N-acetyltransferase
MDDRPPIPLKAVSIEVGSAEFAAISGWPFADPFVGRLLRGDIPQRVQYGNGTVWAYRDPDGRLVGFGTLDVCDECSEYTNGKAHPYVPLLAVNPTIKSLGYGTSIVKHLIDEAALLAMRGLCHDVLFLDTYTANQMAISVYAACGFVTVNPQPIPDPEEGGQPYLVMARRISVSPEAS